MYFRAHLVFSIMLTGILISCNSLTQESIKLKVEKGEILFQTSGCISCHSFGNQQMYGPSLHAILNSNVGVIRNNNEDTLTIDKDYIIRSIKQPDFEKLVDFKNKKMPITTLSDQDIEYIAEYIVFMNRNSPKEGRDKRY